MLRHANVERERERERERDLLLTERPVDDRNPIWREATEGVITAAVKRADSGCEPFVGVIVQRIDPKSPAEVNWAIRSIKSGIADRNKTSVALATIVERMQREFNLSDDCQTAKSGEEED
jgi:hypothetical protein